MEPELVCQCIQQLDIRRQQALCRAHARSCEPTAPLVLGTTAVVNQPCHANPNSQLELVSFDGQSHIGALFFGQRLWFEWIADRFDGVLVPDSCATTSYPPAWPIDAYQQELGYFLQYPVYGYETG